MRIWVKVEDERRRRRTCMRLLRAAASHLAGRPEDLGAERHDGTQHRQEPEDEEDP